jgi:hypothetical protein
MTEGGKCEKQRTTQFKVLERQIWSVIDKP